MDNLNIQKRMYEIATQFISRRFPKGWGGVAVIHTDKGNFFESIALDNANGSTQLCIEVGAMCEAHKYNEKVTHCICVVRENENEPFTILTPCGICQERLRYWGTDVQVGVTTKDNHIKFITLDELQPYHWTNAYPVEELEHFKL
ncbi:MAG: cytidine deaminase [Paraclostridium sp.]|uniref:cytidine deaminase n=1 Tax=Paraclostridium sp. TaxID=2023273 RepID=UPI003F35206E